ncbi:hypothetical protein IFY90_004257 [Salmonella enterica]|nr:hypothetical protein [Salmonella enterica]
MNYDNLSFFEDDYNPTQSNVLGENLAPTAGYSDQLPAMDFGNDDRTPEDWKQGARQANIDADPFPDVDQENIYVSPKGSKYQKVSNSRVDQMMAAVGAYLSTDLATNNPGKAAMAAGQAVYSLEGKAKRFSQIDKLEATGRYTDIDIDKWVETGDNADLTRNQGKWQNMGNGFEANTLTGETRQIPGYQPTQQVATVNTGDQVMFYDKKTGKVVNQVATGAKPGTGLTPGLDALEANGEIQTRTDENGNSYYWKPFANGRGGEWKPYSAQNQKTIDQRKAGATPSAQETQMNSDLSALRQEAQSKTPGFVGAVSYLPESVQNVYTGTIDKEDRASYNKLQRLEGNLTTMGVSQAKAAGASGINTEAELKIFRQGLPRIDRSSAQAYTQSLSDLDNYLKLWSADNRRNLGIKENETFNPNQQRQAAPATQAQPAAKGGDYSHLW